MLLEVEGLDVFYGAVRALKGVSLRAEAGEIVTLIGANGAGKTTLLRTLSGLIPARAWRMRFDGRDITRMPPHEVVALGVSHAHRGAAGVREPVGGRQPRARRLPAEGPGRDRAGPRGGVSPVPAPRRAPPPERRDALLGAKAFLKMLEEKGVSTGVSQSIGTATATASGGGAAVGAIQVGGNAGAINIGNTTTERSGGVDIKGGNVSIGGDVVGRDKKP